VQEGLRQRVGDRIPGGGLDAREGWWHVDEVGEGLAGCPEYAAAGQQRAHDHRAPLEQAELRRRPGAEHGAPSGEQGNEQAHEEGREQQELPVEAEEARRPGEAGIDEPV